MSYPSEPCDVRSPLLSIWRQSSNAIIPTIGHTQGYANPKYKIIEHFHTFVKDRRDQEKLRYQNGAPLEIAINWFYHYTATKLLLEHDNQINILILYLTMQESRKLSLNSFRCATLMFGQAAKTAIVMWSNISVCTQHTNNKKIGRAMSDNMQVLPMGKNGITRRKHITSTQLAHQSQDIFPPYNIFQTQQ